MDTSKRMHTEKLSPTTIFLAKSERRGSSQREGFKNEAGQVFLPPKNSNRLVSWKKKMVEFGYTF